MLPSDPDISDLYSFGLFLSESYIRVFTKAGHKTETLIDNGIEVSIVGKRVVEALNNGELYIFTHPNYRSEIQKRFKAIDDAFKDSEKSIALKASSNR